MTKKFRLDDVETKGEKIAKIVSEFNFIGTKDNLGDFSHDVCVPHCGSYCKCTRDCKCEGYNRPCCCNENYDWTDPYCRCDCDKEYGKKGAGGGHP